MIGLDLGVRVPRAAATAAVEDLYESDSALYKPPRRKAQLAESLCLPTIDAVHRSRTIGFLLKLERLGNRGLHLEGQLVGFDSGPKLGIIRVVDAPAGGER